MASDGVGLTLDSVSFVTIWVEWTWLLPGKKDRIHLFERCHAIEKPVTGRSIPAAVIYSRV
ncbi:hypothetical protein [Methanogenium cariaci]